MSSLIDTFRSALPEALDRLEHLAERENMLHVLRTDQFYPGEQVLCSHPHGTALLLTDQATSEELDVLLTQLASEEPDELVAWIRQQLRLEA